MRLGDRYELHEQNIIISGMIAVYRGTDTQTGKMVAVGLLRDAYKTDPKFVTRFQREAKASASLQHPNILQVHDYGQLDENYFIVMEWVEGKDLRQYLRQRGVLEVDKAVLIAHDVATGLGYMHEKGVVHGHLDLNKILIGRGGDVKLVGFRMNWMQSYAPEQAQGEILSPATDIYLLGNIWYEMLTGHIVFDGDTPVHIAMQHIHDTPKRPSEFNPNIPGPLEDIIMKCLEKEPKKRFRNVSEFARALESLGDMPGPQPNEVTSNKEISIGDAERDAHLRDRMKYNEFHKDGQKEDRTTAEIIEIAESMEDGATVVCTTFLWPNLCLGITLDNQLHSKVIDITLTVSNAAGYHFSFRPYDTRGMQRMRGGPYRNSFDMNITDVVECFGLDDQKILNPGVVTPGTWSGWFLCSYRGPRPEDTGR